MAKRSDSTPPPTVRDDRETLLEIARQIAAADPQQFPDNDTGRPEDAGLAAKQGAPADSAPNAGERAANKDVQNGHADGIIATRRFEALPSGLALCSGKEITQANASFALAFGYATPEELTKAGGLAAIFPGAGKKFEAALKKNGAPENKRTTFSAITRSGRKVDMPLAIHDISGSHEGPVRLLVLHPDSQEVTPASVLEILPGGKPAGSDAAAAPLDGVPETGANGAPPAPAETKHRPPTKAKKPKKNAVGAPDPELVAKVSHEIRTPLNSIIGLADLMNEEKLGPIGNDRYKSYIRDIRKSGGYALSLVNDLLDISKIEAGKFELNFTALNINEAIADCVQTMQPRARKIRVFLRMSLSDDAPRVLADNRSVKQILLNLLANAIRFTSPGGQVIVCSRRKPSGAISIQVRDDGIGMTPDAVEQAMEPFHQLDTAPRKPAATGLGLPLTKALVRANQAKFKLKSSAKSGTRVEITFPADRLAPN